MRKILILLMFSPLLSYGWGEEGHRMVGAIAEMHIKKVTRAKLNKLVGKYSVETLGNWLDWQRKSWEGARTFHYISMPPDATKFKLDDCENDRTCALSMLDKYKGRLLSPIESPESKAEAVKIIIHLIEDLHQPLHTGGQKGDYGGNSVKVSIRGKGSNLHKCYDTDFIIESGKSEEQFIYEISKDLTPERIIEMQKGDPITWAEEAHKFIPEIYSKLPKKKGNVIVLNTEYIDFGSKIVQDQILIGGIRLAAYLDEVLAKVTLN